MPTFQITAVDEYGIFYTAQTLHSADEVMAEIESLEDALEDASVGRTYAIQSVIESLRDQLTSYQESAD
jgi:hypothetical protein